jgi:hypothetical protein
MAGQVGDAVGRNGLAYVCGQLDQIRADLRGDGTGDVSPLQRLLDAVRDGQDIADPLDALHAVLQESGDALGVYGHGARGLRPAGVEDGPLEIAYLCPVGRCSGRRWPEVTAFPVRCDITGKDLRRERL